MLGTETMHRWRHYFAFTRFSWTWIVPPLCLGLPVIAVVNYIREWEKPDDGAASLVCAHTWEDCPRSTTWGVGFGLGVCAACLVLIPVFALHSQLAGPEAVSYKFSELGRVSERRSSVLSAGSSAGYTSAGGGSRSGSDSGTEDEWHDIVRPHSGQLGLMR